MCSFVTGGKGSSVKPKSGAVAERGWPLPDACEIMAVSAKKLQDLRGRDAKVLWENMTPLLCESESFCWESFGGADHRASSAAWTLLLRRNSASAPYFHRLQYFHQTFHETTESITWQTT
jgi:hypothetical protein